MDSDSDWTTLSLQIFWKQMKAYDPHFSLPPFPLLYFNTPAHSRLPCFSRGIGTNLIRNAAKAPLSVGDISQQVREISQKVNNNFGRWLMSDDCIIKKQVVIFIFFQLSVATTFCCKSLNHFQESPKKYYPLPFNKIIHFRTKITNWKAITKNRSHQKSPNHLLKTHAYNFNQLQDYFW